MKSPAEKKAFWFAFNPSDWLSDKHVKLMSLAERGAYIGLLALSWGEEQPGTLPAEEDMIRRLAEISPADWAVSGPAILAVFPLSECGMYRYNKRLLKEAGWREELREKKAEAGRKSAAKRAAVATEGQQSGNTNPTPVEIPATGVDEKGNQLQSQLQLHSSKEEEKLASSAGALASQKKEDRAKEYRCDEAPVFLAENFKAYVTSIGYPEVAWSMYLLRIPQKAAEDIRRKKIKEMATNDEWKRYIMAYLDYDKKHVKLLLPTSIQPPEDPNPALQVVTSTNYGPERMAAQAKKTYL